MNKRGSVAFAVVLIIVIILVIAGGVWYWMAHNSSATQPVSQNTTTATSSTPPNESATQATSTYQNTDYGVSFDYPNNWTVKSGDTAEGDYGLNTQYGIDYAANAVSLITVEIPPSLYPGTNLDGAYFNLSVNKQPSKSQCLTLLPPGPNNGGGAISIDGVMFNWSESGGVGGGTAVLSRNYFGYTNGTCYEFNLGDTTGNDVSPTGTIELGSANDISVLEGVLSSVKFTGASTVSTPPTSATAGTNSNNNQSGIDTSSWQTESIHFAPQSVCYTIKYPPTLTPQSAANGFANSEAFVGAQDTDLVLTNDFNDSYSSLTSNNLGFSIKNFTTDSGLNAALRTDQTGGWSVVIEASENNKNFALTLSTWGTLKNPAYNTIDDAMARSVTLSCALPASPK